MTLCVELARQICKNFATVSASVRDNDRGEKEYTVTVDRGGLVSRSDVHRCAKTTWRKKFREICAEEGSKQG